MDQCCERSSTLPRLFGVVQTQTRAENFIGAQSSTSSFTHPSKGCNRGECQQGMVSSQETK
ncbi:hypothetical protein Tcan_16261 [Toxocara canis]|uniref:Uncharacterized protein n=1 Tax=Toxocara canis TaxID=6265 RepID=A0A0B2V0X7_TOXCA|nr:hypothetical protein Tcan_16261 [Toxocara canis]